MLFSLTDFTGNYSKFDIDVCDFIIIMSATFMCMKTSEETGFVGETCKKEKLTRETIIFFIH